MECFNEILAHLNVRYFLYRTLNVCVIFYIAHLGVRYEIYTLAFPFDLRCQSGIHYIYILSSNDDLQPSTIITNLSPSRLVLSY